MDKGTMQLEIKTMWSPDLTPPSSGLPPDLAHFALLMQVELSEKEQSGGEVFSFTVCSPSSLAQTSSGTFVQTTLVLNQFSWQVVQDRLEKLIAQCYSCENWSDVVNTLSGYLQYNN
jgi:hypothetical protein